ncbi:hypothetical protein BDQ12DRAFT_675017 [Crucibulum laeve]|uniref:GmrSD restriction endonucleases N-terminal domain-containing protein n=1 Tax=Crucibulum laeve TaxID=68775 RepID=A0A5C3MHN4_9AGAR|nr:hypothetical protein BDQ12DRAFT_675017 [Crucibulum laeve]
MASYEHGNLESSQMEIDELEDDDDFTSDTEDPNVFMIRDPLQPPTAKIFSTKELHALIHEGTIDLNATYQRDVVWGDAKQIRLIDSIFRNFYIPPVVFAVQKDEDGEDVRICVDGKQRLTSIQRFFDGQIPHLDTKTKKKFWYVVPESGGRVEVPDYWKRQFCEKQITCVEYYDIAPGTEREIFQRVQLGMALTAAEKLQAISSPWSQWIAELEAKHVMIEGGLSDVIEWDTSRGRNFQNLAYLVFCCDGISDEVIPTAPKIEKWLTRDGIPEEPFKSDIESTLRKYWKTATTRALNKGFKEIQARLAPIEFIFIGVLLFVMRKKPEHNQADAIYKLRSGIRQSFKDIRNNGDVAKALWSYIKILRTDANSPLPIYSVTPNTGRTRKKRKKDAGSENEEYKPRVGKVARTRSKHSKS